ncbi:hypothetical protein ABUR94_15420, partial [Staphylococcus aureus]
SLSLSTKYIPCHLSLIYYHNFAVYFICRYMEIADKWQNRHYRRGSANYKANNVATKAKHSYTYRQDK